LARLSRKPGSGAPGHVIIVRCGQPLAPDALVERDPVIAGERAAATALDRTARAHPHQSVERRGQVRE
jgi:hypothetical protein